MAGGHWGALAGDGPWEAVAPDMHCLCKALANGHPIAALIGNERAREGAAKITASGTYWLAGGPMAAALANLDDDGIVYEVAGMLWLQGMNHPIK